MSTASTPLKPALPPLRHGDRLTRDEFERRYDAMPELKLAELIDGVVHMGSPVRTDAHGQPHAQLVMWLTPYYAGTPGLIVSIGGSVRLDLANEPQPDALLMIPHDRGGQARLDEGGYVEGGPELVAEVSASTVSIDRNAKKSAYLRNGVAEYLLWRVEDGALDWFVLRQGSYEPLAPGPDGVLRSEAFPGLWLDPMALLRGDIARVLAVAQQGLSGSEHQAFVSQLSGA